MRAGELVFEPRIADRALAVQQPRLCQHRRSGADRRRQLARVAKPPQQVEHAPVGGKVRRARLSARQQYAVVGVEVRVGEGLIRAHSDAVAARDRVRAGERDDVADDLRAPQQVNDGQRLYLLKALGK